MVIHELLEMVKRLKSRHERYVIDKLAKANNYIILRLPLYYCELNPVELARSSVKNHIKMNNMTYKFPYIKKVLIEGVNRVNVDI